jgi:hypothetical protein
MLQLFVTLLQIGLSITVGRYIFDAQRKGRVLHNGNAAHAHSTLDARTPMEYR